MNPSKNLPDPVSKEITNPKTPRHHKLFYGSSYDRGLEHLLPMWPKIREQYPDAELHIFYGWDFYDAAYQNNPERLAWKHRMNDDMNQPGIVHHGRVSKEELKKWQQICGIWAYPTHFGETCCITGLDCQYHGCVPCVVNYAALKETVQAGVKVEGDIYDQETKDAYLEALLELMGDEEHWQAEQQKGMKFAKQWSWDDVAARWLGEMEVVEYAKGSGIPAQEKEEVKA